MSLVIEYDTGRFILPKLDISASYRNGKSTVEKGVEYDKVQAMALQIPVTMDNDYYVDLIKSKKGITRYNPDTGDSFVSSTICTDEPPYKLKSGKILYLNVAVWRNSDKPTEPVEFNVLAWLLYDPKTDEIQSLYGYLPSIYGKENEPHWHSLYVDEVFPVIYMFEDASGNAFISFLENDPHSYPYDSYTLTPHRINNTDTDDTKIAYEWLFTEVEGANDPYWQGGNTSTGGGGGNFDVNSEPIDIPTLPSVSATDTGFITLFNPSLGQLQALSNYMWSDLFDLDTLKKLFADPMDAILGLSLVPVSIPNGGITPVKVGNISTDVSMTRAASQFVEVDCGVINVRESYGAYLDYEPYTKAEIYLPYIGIHPIAVDDIMNKAVHVVYHVDILSGACCAYVKCGNSVLYEFVGQCSCSIPITGNDWTNVINGALNIAGAIGSMVASGGATAPMSIGAIASTAVNSFKPSIEKSGALGGMGGMLGIQTPYLILTRPRQAVPESQNSFTGYPSFITTKLNICSGYTEVEKVHLKNIPATSDEIAEIESLLKSGVYF